MIFEKIINLIRSIKQDDVKTVKKAVTEQDRQQSKNKIYGTRGRIEIPELNIGVPLYGTESGGAQEVIDRQDSAVYLRWPGQIAIADHSSQANFSNLNLAKPGHTKAYIVTRDSRTPYICYQTQVGHIRIESGRNTLYDNNWEPVFAKNHDGLTMYTCIKKSAPNVMDVRLVYWKQI